MEEKDFRRLYWPTYRFFSNRCYRPEVAEELTQETFLEAHRAFSTFRGDSTLDTWLFSIAKNVWLRHFRDSKAQKRSADEIPLDAVEDEDLGSSSTDPLQHSITAEEGEALRLALAELPEEQRQCVFMRLDQELRYREIAAILHISINRVRSHLFEARKKLKRRLRGRSADTEA